MTNPDHLTGYRVVKFDVPENGKFALPLDMLLPAVISGTADDAITEHLDALITVLDERGDNGWREAARWLLDFFTDTVTRPLSDDADYQAARQAGAPSLILMHELVRARRHGQVTSGQLVDVAPIGQVKGATRYLLATAVGASGLAAQDPEAMAEITRFLCADIDAPTGPDAPADSAAEAPLPAGVAGEESASGDLLDDLAHANPAPEVDPEAPLGHLAVDQLMAQAMAGTVDHDGDADFAQNLLNELERRGDDDTWRLALLWLARELTQHPGPDRDGVARAKFDNEYQALLQQAAPWPGALLMHRVLRAMPEQPIAAEAMIHTADTDHVQAALRHMIVLAAERYGVPDDGLEALAAAISRDVR